MASLEHNKMNISLTFTQEQLQILDRALQQLPYYMAQPVIAEINRQIEAQAAKAVEETQKEEAGA
jgi:hypothetical protein